MISIEAAVSFIVTLIVVGLIFYLLWWLLNYCNPPEPFKKVGSIVLAVIAVLVLIGLLLGLTGHQVFRP